MEILYAGDEVGEAEALWLRPRAGFLKHGLLTVYTSALRSTHLGNTVYSSFWTACCRHGWELGGKFELYTWVKTLLQTHLGGRDFFW